ncbi:TetR/AcrR family transcriptional regulator [Nocardioides endophyticus]|uniref:TetR/AcrR family transcriptional regulator n=1 Tax=Nocardioides endophyticus TaxID=1353775 RepID=A0ABP8YPZ7_9ACTN
MEETASSSRRSKERAAMRRRIVETALQLLEQEGTTAVTTRRVATEMDYTAPIVYQHFENKDALVLELVSHGYQMLTAELQEVSAQTDPSLRLLSAATSYVRFAGQHPHLFDAMNVVAVESVQRSAIVEPVLDLLQDWLGVWASSQRVDLGDNRDACDVVWGTLYGIGALGRLDSVGNERAQRLARQALEAILSGWLSQGGQRPA